MRRESSTVVVTVGEIRDSLLTEVSRYPNVSVTRPPDDAGDAIEAAASALAQASRKASPFVLVPADPLAAVASAWRAMWDVSGGARGGAEFEQRASETMTAWRAGKFELPDYYLVVTPANAEAEGPDLYLGPLQAIRPRRVATAVGSGRAEQAARILESLRSLRHGPWWPPLEEIIDGARRFFAGSLAGAEGTLAAPTAGRP
ncbi:MAG: hypothetical protein J2P35_15845 [Actinobacteria bacterium]|nr:hypothetical protein [Actinomycetota bacterium]